MIYDFFIDIVGTCNLSCPSCPTGNFKNLDFYDKVKPKGFMELDDFHIAIKKISEFQNPSETSLHLYNWGEPLLHPQFNEILAKASDYEFKIYISSNLNTNKNITTLLKHNVKFLRISNSGYYQNTYKISHRKGDINLVKSNMYLLRHLMDKRKSCIDIELFYHMYKSNIGKDLIKMKDLCNELNYRFTPIVANFVNVEKVMQYIDNDVSNEDKSTISNLLISIEDSIKISNKKEDNSCHLYENQIVINFDGTISLCCGVYDPRYLLSKNILKHSLFDIQESKSKFSQYCKKCTEIGIHNYLMAKNENEIKSFVKERYNLKNE
jgi:MoaA/NifB/PqqE/SkfB family radical SAM enzyme